MEKSPVTMAIGLIGALAFVAGRASTLQQYVGAWGVFGVLVAVAVISALVYLFD